MRDAEPVIREALVTDARGVADVKVRAWRAAYAGFMSAAVLDALDPADESADWAAYIAAMPDGHRLWIAGAPGEVLGFCRTGPAESDPDLGPDAGEVYGLYLDPDRVGSGLGRRLFAHAVTELAERGRRPLCVYAYRPNGRALRFYERAGFTRDGATRLDDDSGADDAGAGVGVVEVRLVLRDRSGA